MKGRGRGKKKEKEKKRKREEKKKEVEKGKDAAALSVFLSSLKSSCKPESGLQKERAGDDTGAYHNILIKEAEL